LASISSCKNKDVNNKGSIKIIDSTNTEISFNETPKRVVILESSFACIWKLSGGSYVGIPDNYNEYSVNGIELESATNIGDYKHPVAETIIACRPDLIIYSSKDSMSGHKTVIEQIKSTGYQCKYYGVNIDSFEDYLYTLKQFTILNNRNDLYITNGENVNSEINKVKELSENKTGPKVLLVRNVNGNIKVVYNNHITLTMLTDIKCTNIGVEASSSNLSVAIEAIIEYEPEIVFFVQMGTSTSQDKLTKLINEQILEKNEWKALKTKNPNMKFITLDQNLYNRIPNNKWAEAYQNLYNIIYGQES